MKIVAVKERSEGNESVGSMWVETAIFDDSARIREVLKWANMANPERGHLSGRLMLTVVDEPDKADEQNF